MEIASILVSGFILGAGAVSLIYYLLKPKLGTGVLINHYRQILELLFTIKQNQESMNAENKALLQQIIDQVSAENTVIGSAVTLLTTFKQKLDDALNGKDEDLRASLTNLSTLVGQGKDQLASAVVANTPADTTGGTGTTSGTPATGGTDNSGATGNTDNSGAASGTQQASSSIEQ